jgi:hypothetical protein
MKFVIASILAAAALANSLSHENSSDLDIFGFSKADHELI